MITQERAAAEQSRRRSSVARAKIASLLSPGSILAYNASSSRLLVARLKKARLNLRQRCFLLLYEPSSSTLAVVVSFILWSIYRSRTSSLFELALNTESNQECKTEGNLARVPQPIECKKNGNEAKEHNHPRKVPGDMRSVGR